MRAFLVPSLILLLLIELLISIDVIGSLFGCDIFNIYGIQCKATFFAQHSPYPNPYPAISPILFFLVLLIVILVPISTLILISVKSKKVAAIKMILYIALIPSLFFYTTISSKSGVRCSLLSCVSFGQAENQLAKSKNLKIYEPSYLPESLKNQQRIKSGSYPYLEKYGLYFSINEETFIKLEDCSIEKDSFITGGTCEVIKDGNFEARYIYKESNESFMKWNMENTTIIINSRNNLLAKEELLKIAKSFE